MGVVKNAIDTIERLLRDKRALKSALSGSQFIRSTALPGGEEHLDGQAVGWMGNVSDDQYQD
jgi:hypothetical protein